LNAIQASPAGRAVTVSTSGDPEGGGIEIRFRDQGPGIPVEARREIFEPFFTTKGTGTGLGLPISKKIIEGHGGSIEVESEPGKGATFRVRLPGQPQEAEG
jgi:two-component system, NtrC family, sensor histidine kinase HydH